MGWKGGIVTRREYNGWTNYETWLVGLWLDNSQGDQEEAQRIVRAERLDTGGAAEAIRDWIQELAPEMDSLYGDLLGAALSEVNWQEIAEHFAEPVEETEEAEA